MAHELSCSVACGIFPDQGSNPCPLHWQADSQPLHHQGSPHWLSFTFSFLTAVWIWHLFSYCNLSLPSSPKSQEPRPQDPVFPSPAIRGGPKCLLPFSGEQGKRWKTLFFITKQAQREVFPKRRGKSLPRRNSSSHSPTV